jgi:heme-degrading monooxygenase HmoA
VFSVIFEVHPKLGQRDAYLDNAKMLRPELMQVDGFVDNIRYKSLTREGWILSLSGWRDEKAVVRWRTTMRHHMVQEKGRSEILRDYHLRVGQITQDTRIPDGFTLQEQRLDETVVGDGTTVTLIDAKRPAQWAETPNAGDCSKYLGLNPDAGGIVAWDVCDAVLTPGDLILLMSWRTKSDAEAFENRLNLPENARLRRVRIVRDYGMFDRREAPQYYPEVAHPSGYT